MNHAQPATVVEAEVFILRDHKGKVRARLTMTEDGPSLEMLDLNGTPRLVFGLIEDTPQVGLYDADKRIRALLKVTPDGPSFALFKLEEAE